MSTEASAALRELLSNQTFGALGTLHDGEPFVSMVPIALLPDGTGFVIHVSALASHTRDLLANPRVSLLMVAPDAPGLLPQARPRVTVRGDARQVAKDDDGYAAARSAYLERFPQSAPMFDFADFSLFLIEPLSARLVAGFAQAETLSPGQLATAIAGA